MFDLVIILFVVFGLLSAVWIMYTTGTKQGRGIALGAEIVQEFNQLKFKDRYHVYRISVSKLRLNERSSIGLEVTRSRPGISRRMMQINLAPEIAKELALHINMAIDKNA